MQALFYAQFTLDVHNKFLSAVQDILETYCNSGRCLRYIVKLYASFECVNALSVSCRQTTNAQYIVTIRKMTSNTDGLMIILQVHTSSTVLSAAVITEALTVS